MCQSTPVGDCKILVLVVLVLCGLTHGQDINVKWGVADSTAIIGHLFRLHIPNDAFSGNPEAYVVKASEGDSLPSWLEFDATENVLQGIPTPKDAGQLDLEVTGKGAFNEASTSLNLLVRDVQSHTSGSTLKFKKSGPEFVHCKREEPETVATIIVDADMQNMPSPNRIALLKKFLSHMELHEDMVKMVPVGHTAMYDSSALVSGTGDCTSPKNSGLFISWPVGCGQVKEGHFPILKRLDDDSGNGKMAKVLEYCIIGWHVTNSHIPAPKRKRRAVHPTPTASITPVVATKTKAKEENTDDAEIKLTRPIVEMETPAMIKPTATQPDMVETDDPTTAKPDKKKDKMDEDRILPSVVDPRPVVEKETPMIKPTIINREDSGSTDTPIVATCDKGQKPVLIKTFKITTQSGSLIDFLIPEDTFEDCEVGGTRGLKLILVDENNNVLSTDSYIKLDEKQQKIVGLPIVDKRVKKKFILLAQKVQYDSLFEKAEFFLVIKPLKTKKVNHELSVTIDFPFNQFKSSLDNQTNLANKVASIYGDSDASNLAITTLKKGSVIYGWANKSAMSDGCNVEIMNNLVGKLMNDDGSLTQDAIDKMDPFFLKSAGSMPKGSCESVDGFPKRTSQLRERPIPNITPMTPTSRPDVPVVPVLPVVPVVEKNTTVTETVEKDEGKISAMVPKPDDKSTTEATAMGKESRGGDDGDDIWITTVVPAVVIVVILLIALFIACILYRKKRKGKMNVEEQNTFVNKGAPVIFPDELEDKPSDVNKPLLVEGGSVAPPPEYHRGASENPETDSHNNHRYNNVNSAPNVDGIQEFPERPYEPPVPPVAGSSNNKQPRPTQQQPFSQPPQILP